MAFMPQMKPAHAEAFKNAAKLYGVYILVRRTNLRSLDHIGDPACVPKRLDCKAKTATHDFHHPRFGYKRTAGLVVDPTIITRAAFSSDARYADALREWAGFAREMIDPAVATLEGQKRLTWVPNGRFYFVDLNPDSERYGCVRFTISSVLAAGKYVHGDFDLYGIVRADNPAANTAVREVRLDQKHERSPEFFDVQHYVNRQIGVPMVLHGAHEAHASEHSNEGIDIFHPDGSVTGAENAVEIHRLYETEFKGRRLFTKGGAREIGKFSTPG